MSTVPDTHPHTVLLYLVIPTPPSRSPFPLSRHYHLLTALPAFTLDTLQSMPHMAVKRIVFFSNTKTRVCHSSDETHCMVSPRSYKKFKLLACPLPAPPTFFLPCTLCPASWPWFIPRYILCLFVPGLILNVEHLHPHTQQFPMSTAIPLHLLGLSVNISSFRRPALTSLYWVRLSSSQTWLHACNLVSF